MSDELIVEPEVVNRGPRTPAERKRDQRAREKAAKQAAKEAAERESRNQKLREASEGIEIENLEHYHQHNRSLLTTEEQDRYQAMEPEASEVSAWAKNQCALLIEGFPKDKAAFIEGVNQMNNFVNSRGGSFDDADHPLIAAYWKKESWLNYLDSMMDPTKAFILYGYVISVPDWCVHALNVTSQKLQGNPPRVQDDDYIPVTCVGACGATAVFPVKYAQAMHRGENGGWMCPACLDKTPRAEEVRRKIAHLKAVSSQLPSQIKKVKTDGRGEY